MYPILHWQIPFGKHRPSFWHSKFPPALHPESYFVNYFTQNSFFNVSESNYLQVEHVGPENPNEQLQFPFSRHMPSFWQDK